MALAGRLRQRRLEKGWSQTELARQTGIARSYLYRLEGGDSSRPSVEVLQRLAKALDTTVTDLLEQPDPVAPSALPPSLLRLADRDNLSPEDVATLAAIWYRGEQPRSVDGWAHVLSAIRFAIVAPADES